MIKYIIKRSLDKKLKRIQKKDKDTFLAILNKIIEVAGCESVNYYKNLRKPMQNLKRVHIKKSFVLTFEYNKKENLISFIDFEHHDKIYK
jgi:mRNA-degrading endonuclease RelE of RelBE toxin-antitoxin system